MEPEHSDGPDSQHLPMESFALTILHQLSEKRKASFYSLPIWSISGDLWVTVIESSAEGPGSFQIIGSLYSRFLCAHTHKYPCAQGLGMA